MTPLYSFDWEGTLFIFFKSDQTTWWPITILFKKLNIYPRMNQFFKKHSISQKHQKRFSDFSTSFVVLPKNTYFISEEAFKSLLIWLEKEYPAEKVNIQALLTIVENLERLNVVTKVEQKIILQKKQLRKNSLVSTKERQKLKEISGSAIQLNLILNAVLMMDQYQLDKFTKEKCLDILKQMQKQLQSCKVKSTETV